jgi:hypothetical protein
MVPTNCRVEGSPFCSTKTSKEVPGWVCAVTSRSTRSVVEVVPALASALCSFGFGTGRSTLTCGRLMAMGFEEPIIEVVFLPLPGAGGLAAGFDDRMVFVVSVAACREQAVSLSYM